MNRDILRTSHKLIQMTIKTDKFVQLFVSVQSEINTSFDKSARIF